MVIDQTPMLRLLVSVHKKKDGLLLINRLGEARYMTTWERIKYTLWGAEPKV
jgi:hypothetical protein